MCAILTCINAVQKLRSRTSPRQSAAGVADVEMAPHPGPFDPVGERIEESMSTAARARTRARATRDIEKGGDGGSEPRALPPVAVLRSAGSSAMDLPIAEATESATAAVLSRSVGDINRASSLPVAEA